MVPRAPCRRKPQGKDTPRARAPRVQRACRGARASLPRGSMPCTSSVQYALPSRAGMQRGTALPERLHACRERERETRSATGMQARTSQRLHACSARAHTSPLFRQARARARWSVRSLAQILAKLFVKLSDTKDSTKNSSTVLLQAFSPHPHPHPHPHTNPHHHTTWNTRRVAEDAHHSSILLAGWPAALPAQKLDHTARKQNTLPFVLRCRRSSTATS